MHKAKQEILDIIQQNERKSRYRLVAWIAVCLLLGALTIYYGVGYQHQSKKLKAQYEILETQKEQLQQLKDSIERQATAFEEARHQMTLKNDSLLQLLDKAGDKLRLNDPFRDDIRQEVEKVNTAGAIVYFQQYGPQSRALSDRIRGALLKQGFTAPGIEQMKKAFDSRITYFHKEDAALADEVYKEVAAVLQQRAPGFDLDSVKPKLSKIKAPERQIEVWLNL